MPAPNVVEPAVRLPAPDKVNAAPPFNASEPAVGVSPVPIDKVPVLPVGTVRALVTVNVPPVKLNDDAEPDENVADPAVNVPVPAKVPVTPALIVSAFVIGNAIPVSVSCEVPEVKVAVPVLIDPVPDFIMVAVAPPFIVRSFVIGSAILLSVKLEAVPEANEAAAALIVPGPAIAAVVPPSIIMPLFTVNESPEFMVSVPAVVEPNVS